LVSILGWCASHDRREEPSLRPWHRNPNRTINTEKFASTTEATKRGDLLRSEGLGSGTILGEEFPNFFT
jgi:hypothetical protein